ncbi:hypothetical protein HY374_01310 [Candidatus Berkelbacteria bacterium]|nr:hypothetical protein [Candidatus Berkelbacteria bacterium]
MAKRGTKQIWSGRKARDAYEQRELAIYQAQTAAEFRAAYDALTGQDGTHTYNVRGMYEQAGPAALVTLALRGYELPDAATRLESNRVLLTLATHLEVLEIHERLTEQFWLMLAQQQDVLLEHIEDDLEALVNGASEGGETEQILTALHTLIRARSAKVVDALFAGQPQPHFAFGSGGAEAA